MSRLPASASLDQRLGEEVLEEEHLDPTGAHLDHELVVLLLGPLDPEHIVEQQVVVVRRREPPQAQVRSVDHDLSQLADLRVDTDFAHPDSSQ